MAMTKEMAVKGLKRLRSDFSGYKPNEEMFDMAIEALLHEPKHGRWIDGENMNGEKFLADIKYCSVCHKEAYWDSERGQQLFPCCPNCGARME